MFWRSVVIAGAVWSVFAVAGAVERLRSGTYVTEGAWGALRIQAVTNDGSQAFNLDARGVHAHTCQLTGRIKDGVARLDDECVVEFIARQDRIAVRPRRDSEDACRAYCGARASFEEEYFFQTPYCRGEPMVRDKFLQYSRSSQLQKARDILTGLLERCEKFMFWRAVAEVRNDLATTEFRLGNYAACLKAIEPLRKRGFLEDPEDIFFEPPDEAWGQAMAKTTRFNWKKCGGTLPTPEGITGK